MKYVKKAEEIIEFEAGDIAEWKDPTNADKILMIVRITNINYMDGIVFYDSRGYAVPHNVTLKMAGKYLGRIRKVPESEWREW